MRRLELPNNCDPLVRRLHAEVTAAGIPLAAVARRSGVSQTAIHHWMHCRRSPTVGNLVACFNALGLDLVVVPLPTQTRNPANDARANVAVREVPFG